MTLRKSFLSPTFLCFPRLAPATTISFALCMARLISRVYKIGHFNIEPNVILYSCHGFSRSVSVLLDFILEDIRARYDLLMSWLYQEYNASESEETSDEMEFSQSYCDCLLSLMDGLYSSLDPKDKYVSMSVFVCFMFLLYSLLVIRKGLFFAGFQVPGVEMQEDFRLCCPSRHCTSFLALGHGSRKSRRCFGPEKPFVKLRLAYSVKLVFSYVVRGI